MREADVVLTDFALVILCAWFVLRLRKSSIDSEPQRTIWLLFFSASAVASFTGGLTHAFFFDQTTLAYQFLWLSTLLAMGFATGNAWLLTGLFLSKPKQFTAWIVSAIVNYLIYVAAIFIYWPKFIVAIVNYLPALLGLFIAALIRYYQSGLRAFLCLASGIMVGLLAAFLHQAKIALHPHYFDHNSTYHLIQAIGLYLLFMSAKRLLEPNENKVN